MRGKVMESTAAQPRQVATAHDLAGVGQLSGEVNGSSQALTFPARGE